MPPFSPFYRMALCSEARTHSWQRTVRQLLLISYLDLRSPFRLVSNRGPLVLGSRVNPFPRYMCIPVVTAQDAANFQHLIPLSSHDGVDVFPIPKLEGTKVLVEPMSKEKASQVSVFLLGDQ